MSQNALPVDVVLLPDDEQSALALKCSQQLSAQGSLFTLDNQNFYAHASVYMFQMSLKSQDMCVDALEKTAKGFPVQTLAQAGYYYQDTGFGKGYVDIMFARNEVVDNLQQAVVDIFNSLRTGMRENDKTKMNDATGIKLLNLQRYGYPAIGDLFRPHITLTKFPADVEPDLSVLPPPERFSGKFTKLGLFEMGSNGTCIRKIAEFDLHSSTL